MRRYPMATRNPCNKQMENGRHFTDGILKCIFVHEYVVCDSNIIWSDSGSDSGHYYGSGGIGLEASNPWASSQIRKIAGAHSPGMPGTFFPPPRVSDPDMHHGTCVMHVPWCMPGSLTSGFLWSGPQGETFPAFPVHAQLAILRIWLEAHNPCVLDY